MELEKVKSILRVSNRNKVKYRDEYNFIIWGICLSKEIETNNNVSFILIDNLENKVDIKNIIEVKAI